MNDTIRNIQSKDKKGIQQLVEILNEKDNLGYSITEEWLDYVIQEAGESIFILIYSNQLVGLATCMINQTDSNHAVVNVVIHPEYRNLGFGSKLYHEIVNYAKYKKVKSLETYVKERLSGSVEFAAKKGFQPVLYSWQMELELNKTKIDKIEKKESHLIFRKGTILDGTAYARIINQSFGDELDDRVLEGLSKDPSIQVYMLENQDKTIGTVTMQYRNNLSVGYIYDVAIAEKYRRQGLGSYMLGACIDKLIKKNICKASLLVSGQNKSALALYHRLGFKDVDTDIVMHLPEELIK